MSDYLSIVDDADLQKDNPQWKPSEWIGRQHTFNDVPHFVAVEAARALEIPIEFKSSLPRDTLAPPDFFASSTLPPWDPDIDTADVNFLVGFDATHPSFNPSSPCDIPLLPLAIIRQLRNTHGQAWLDGKKSIRDARTPDHQVHLGPRDHMDNAGAEDGETEESQWRDRTVELLSLMTGWTGRVDCGLQDLTFEHLAEVLGENELTDTILDALMKDLERRLKASNGDSSAVVVADTFLPRCIAAGAARTPGHFGYPVIRTYNYLLSPANSSARILAFPVHSPPNHWMACHVDITEARIRFGDGFRGSPPKILSKELAEWLQVATEMAHPVITDDLPCGEQHDVVNCGIIAVNAIAHSILGNVLWQSGDARTLRFRAFCTIADMILTHSHAVKPAPPPIETTESEDVEMQDVNTAATVQFTEDDIEELLDSIDEDESAAPLLPAKRQRDEDERENKSEAPAAKRMKETSPSRSNPSPLSTSAHATTVNTAAHSSRATGKVAKPGKRIPVPGKKPKIPRAVQLEIRDSLRSGGQSGSARHDRTVAIIR
ncbi:hypothetical protein B0H14DRAFT_3458877 [Mycena olivaceomarginata]|nr:hypothetical protein B0H14DRAFT_3458877 [Mycena olivaceomarginata]